YRSHDRAQIETNEQCKHRDERVPGSRGHRLFREWKELKQAPILAQGRLCPIRTGREQQSGRWPAARRHYRLSSVLLQGLHADLIPDFHGQMEGAVGGGNATVDGAVDQHLLDLVTRYAIVARRLEVHL